MPAGRAAGPHFAPAAGRAPAWACAAAPWLLHGTAPPPGAAPLSSSKPLTLSWFARVTAAPLHPYSPRIPLHCNTRTPLLRLTHPRFFGLRPAFPVTVSARWEGPGGGRERSARWPLLRKRQRCWPVLPTGLAPFCSSVYLTLGLPQLALHSQPRPLSSWAERPSASGPFSRPQRCSEFRATRLHALSTAPCCPACSLPPLAQLQSTPCSA